MIDVPLLDIASKYGVSAVTLAAYLADALLVVPTRYEPQTDRVDPQIVLAEYRLRILGGDYGYTLREIGEAAYTLPVLLEQALIQRLYEAGIVKK
jgi:hypothetical protein